MVSQRIPAFRGRARIPRVILSTGLGLGLFLGACEKKGEPPETGRSATEGDVTSLLDAVRGAYGGPGILQSVTGYRAEAVLSEARNKRTGEMVLWYHRPDRLRLEYRYPEGGHLQILNRERAWLGPDDRDLAPADSTFLTSMKWEARCRGLPWSLLQDQEVLALLDPDEEGRSVLRAPLGNRRVLDHHLDPKTHRVVRLTLRDAAEDILYEMDLGEFRWVRGFLVPFKETVSDRGSRAIEIRFRDVQIDPDFPDPLFEPVR